MKRSSKKLPKDPNQLAAEIVRLSTEENEETKPSSGSSNRSKENGINFSRELISKVMSEMGRKGGRKGGKVRAERLTPERRREIAQKAARKRWKRKIDLFIS